MTVSYFAGRFTAVAGNVNTRHGNLIFVIMNSRNVVVSHRRRI